MAVTDLTGYTWVANNSLNLPYNNFNYSISFTSNSLQYSSMTFFADLQTDLDDEEYYELWFSYDNTWVYNFVEGTAMTPWSTYGAWSNNSFKTIQITGGTDVTNPTLIAWLEANGTLTAPEPRSFQDVKLTDYTDYITLNINGVDFNLMKESNN